MRAIYELTIKLTMVQDVQRVSDLINPREVIERSSQVLCDNNASMGFITTYEILDNKMEAK